MEKEIITAFALGIGLAAAIGFRVFVPLLLGGLAARQSFLPLNDSFHRISSNAATGSFTMATPVFHIINSLLIMASFSLIFRLLIKRHRKIR